MEVDPKILSLRKEVIDKTKELQDCFNWWVRLEAIIPLTLALSDMGLTLKSYYADSTGWSVDGPSMTPTINLIVKGIKGKDSFSRFKRCVEISNDLKKVMGWLEEIDLVIN